LLVYGPIVFSLILIAEGALILIGPLVGGPIGYLSSAMRDVYADDDRLSVDPVEPVALVGAEPSMLKLNDVAEGGTTVELPVEPIDLSADERCTVLHYEASLGIDKGYVSFGRFNVVSDTDPYGQSDSLTQWKLLQFGGFPIKLEAVDRADAVSIPVKKTVNLLISDPYSEEMLFSAKWQIDTIEVRGRHVSINADLATNLSGIGVNNAIDSPTLESFARDGRGVLVMGFSHSADVVSRLQAGQPVYAPVSGVMYPAACQR
jgi:hypothetical protein